MTGKTKVLTIFFSVFGIIVLLVILSSTLFSVKSISVNWQSTKSVLNSVLDEEIISTSNIKSGTSVFLVSKTKAKNFLEKKYPYIKVLNIETKFPNKIIIHAVERNEVFAFQKDDEYFITDSDLKVLKVESGEYVSSNNNPIKVENTYDQDVQVGDFLKVHQNFDALKMLENSFYQNYDADKQFYYLVDMLAYFNSVSVSDEKLLIKYVDGVNIAIYNPTVNQQKKLAMALYMIDNELDANDKKTGTISIITKDGKIVGSYKQ